MELTTDVRHIAQRQNALLQRQLKLIEELAAAQDAGDDGEFGSDGLWHSTRVGEVSAQLASILGWTAAQVSLIRRAAPLHDLGKFAIPEAILLKPSSLSPQEFAVVKQHTSIGSELLHRPQSPLLMMAAQIALTHHERWDGSGYPNGLRGNEIPLCGRIVAVADVYDALTRPRVYKEAWSAERAVQEIVSGRGTKFDPLVVDAFLRMQHGR